MNPAEAEKLLERRKKPPSQLGRSQTPRARIAARLNWVLRTISGPRNVLVQVPYEVLELAQKNPDALNADELRLLIQLTDQLAQCEDAIVKAITYTKTFNTVLKENTRVRMNEKARDRARKKKDSTSKPNPLDSWLIKTA